MLNGKQITIPLTLSKKKEVTEETDLVWVCSACFEAMNKPKGGGRKWYPRDNKSYQNMMLCVCCENHKDYYGVFTQL